MPEAILHINAIQYDVDKPNATIAAVDPNYYYSQT
jgi:hypothetical protein